MLLCRCCCADAAVPMLLCRCCRADAAVLMLLCAFMVRSWISSKDEA
jgi:hypothetical protein